MEVTNEITAIVSELLERYKTNIDESGHKASGDLQNTAKFKCSYNGKWFEVTFILVDYWKYLENGTKPHFPPVKDDGSDKSTIEKWITVKHIIPTTKNGRVPTTKQLAFMIARSISIHGTKPTKLLQKTINDSEDLITALCNEIIKQIEQEIDKEEIL